MKDLTHGPVRGHVWSMTLFMLASMLLQTLYSLIDLYWIGRLGKEAIAAVSVSGNLQMIVFGLSQTLGVGVGAVVSHAVGRKDVADAQRLFNQALGLALLMGVAFAVVGLALRDFYADSMTGDAPTALLAREFLLWFIPALAIQFPLVALGAGLRGAGSMKPGLYAQLATIVINIALAPVLIFGWGTGVALGVAGAGLATFIGIASGGIGLAWYLRHESRLLHVHARRMWPDGSAWRRMLGIGAPAGAEIGVSTVYMFFIYALIRPFGAAAQAGFGIGSRIMQSGFMPAMAVSFACAAVVGQNYAAGRHDRVRDTFWAGARIATGMMVFFTLLCHIAPGHMVAVFSDDPAVVGVGEDYLRVISWNYLAFGVTVASGGLFQGLGNAWPSLVGQAFRVTVVAVPAWWLSTLPGFQLTQIWWLSVAGVIVQTGICAWFLRRAFIRRLGSGIRAAVAVEAA